MTTPKNPFTLTLIRADDSEYTLSADVISHLEPARILVLCQSQRDKRIGHFADAVAWRLDAV